MQFFNLEYGLTLLNVKYQSKIPNLIREQQIIWDLTSIKCVKVTSNVVTKINNLKL